MTSNINEDEQMKEDLEKLRKFQLNLNRRNKKNNTKKNP